jgi:chromosome segregation ATPase
MPDKTHGELIRELRDMVIALTERVDNLLRDVDRHETALNRLNDSLAALSNRVSVLEHQIAETRKTMEESGRRWWALLPAILGALVGGVAAFLGQLLFFYLRK